jgi:recombination associated protein RdgC
MITNAILYNLTAMPPAGFDVLGALQPAAFVPCGPTQALSAGWVPPREANGPLCEGINGQLILKLMVESKKVPAEIIDRKLQYAIRKIEELTGRKPGKKERRELKDEILFELLPSAFPKREAIIAWIDPIGRKLVVGTSSQAKADRVASSLVGALTGLECTPVHTNTTPATAMTKWLLGRSQPETLAIEEDCELKSDGGTKVKYIKHNLRIPEVIDHIHTGGMVPSSLDLTWLGRVNFTLTDSLVLKKIDILGNLLEGHPEQVDAFDADVVIATTEINGLIADLIADLDGEALPVCLP